MTRIIYHMCPANTWRAAVRAGTYRGTADDLRDGFIHFSTAGQIAESARRHRAGQSGLVLIAVESARLGERLRWEPSRGGALFPHLYGPLAPSQVDETAPPPRGADGEHVLPPLRPADS